MSPQDVRGLTIAGKMLSGKDTLLKVSQSYVGGTYVQKVAFADKLKLIAKEMLVLISSYIEHGFCHQRNLTFRDHFKAFTRKVSFDLFGEETGEIAEQVYTNLRKLSLQNHVLLYARLGITMPAVNKEFGFDDIDALLWADCGKPRQMLQELGTEYMRSIRDSVWVDYAFKTVRSNPHHFFVISDCRFENEIVKCRSEKFLDVRIEAAEEIRQKRALTRDGQALGAFLNHPSEISLDGFPFSVTLENNGSIEDLRTTVLENETMRDLLVLLKRRSARQMLAVSD